MVKSELLQELCNQNPRLIRKDIEKILVIAKSLNCQVLTTEKDYLRLTVKDLNQINYIKSELKITNEENFINSVLLNEIY